MAIGDLGDVGLENHHYCWDNSVSGGGGGFWLGRGAIWLSWGTLDCHSFSRENRCNVRNDCSGERPNVTCHLKEIPKLIW